MVSRPPIIAGTGPKSVNAPAGIFAWSPFAFVSASSYLLAQPCCIFKSLTFHVLSAALTSGVFTWVDSGVTTKSLTELTGWLTPKIFAR